MRKCLFRMAMVLIASGTLNDRADGQIFPDPKMTHVFENELKAWAKSQTRVFVSDCNLSMTEKEKAVLVFPVGSPTGTLVLVSRGDVYNGAGVTIDKNGPILVDLLGGEWSHRRLHGIADQLINFRFALMQSEDVKPLLKNKSSNNCVEPSNRPNS